MSREVLLLVDALARESDIPGMEVQRGVSGGATIMEWTPLDCERATSTSDAIKILQSEHTMGELLEPTPGQFVMVLGETPSHLQYLDINSVMCFMASTLKHCVVTPLSQHFEDRFRVVQTDKHAAHIFV
jgi:hypothetical protein